MYAVIRIPCTPEDEGHYSFVKMFGTKEEANAWIAKQEGEYFDPGEYFVMVRDS